MNKIVCSWQQATSIQEAADVLMELACERPDIEFNTDGPLTLDALSGFLQLLADFVEPEEE